MAGERRAWKFTSSSEEADSDIDLIEQSFLEDTSIEEEGSEMCEELVEKIEEKLDKEIPVLLTRQDGSGVFLEQEGAELSVTLLAETSSEGHTLH